MSWRFSLLNRFEDPPGGITEGPAWNGEVVVFTHIHASRIYSFNPRSGDFAVYRENTNRTNGSSGAARTAAPLCGSIPMAAW